MMWTAVEGNGQGADLTGKDFSEGFGGRGAEMFAALHEALRAWCLDSAQVLPWNSTASLAMLLRLISFLIYKMSIGIIFTSSGCSEVKRNSSEDQAQNIIALVKYSLLSMLQRFLDLLLSSPTQAVKLALPPLLEHNLKTSFAEN